MTNTESPRIAIIELHTDNHYSFIDAWVQVLSLVTNDITIFSRGEFAAIGSRVWPCRLELSPIGMPIEHYLHLIRTRGTFDWVVFTTFEGYFLKTLLRWPRARGSIVCVHNANRWFSPQQKNLKATLEKVLRRVILGRVDAVAFTSSGIRAHVKNQLGYRGPTVVVPFGLGVQKPNKRIPTSTFTVVVPGSLSLCRRRYDRVLHAAESLPHVRFVLLGGPHRQEGGLELVTSLREHAPRNLFYFSEFVDDSSFAEEMERADLIVADLQVNFESHRSDELYGLTKDSGVSYLMLEYGLPGLFNVEFHNLPELNAATLGFDSESTLIARLNTLSDRGAQYQQLRSEAEVARADFVPEHFWREEVQPLFERKRK